MGHAEAYALGDVIARYWRQQGFNVLHPIGWDSFGLPAENAAIKRGTDPREWTYANIEQQRQSMRRYAASFDWDRVLRTSDPEYYKWNQWLFLKLYEKGLAYRKASWVNWCPYDQTVLANEQVVDGRCERCDNIVVKKKLTQWYFKITDYADRLLDDLNQLEGSWPSKVIAMQRNWIGRSTGADVDFVIEGHPEVVSVFTTRPDTLFGATFMVVAPDSELAAQLVAESTPEVQAAFAAYLEQVQKSTEIERQDATRDKTGVSLGRFAINPVNGERIPVWAADYVLTSLHQAARQSKSVEPLTASENAVEVHWPCCFRSSAGSTNALRQPGRRRRTQPSTKMRLRVSPRSLRSRSESSQWRVPAERRFPW